MISILIPCYNEINHISKCIQSVRDFEIPEKQEIEVLILDGMSDDGTRGIISKLCENEPRLRMVDNPGRTQSRALNIGIRESRGEWIMRLDAHAAYPKDYLQLCYETAERTGAANVGGVCVTFPGGKNYSARVVQALTTHRFGVGNSGFRTGARAGPRDTVPFGFFRREVFDEAGYFDERLVRTQDYEFNRRLRYLGKEIYFEPSIKSSYFNLSRFSSFLKKQFLNQGPYNAYMWYLAPYSFTPRHAITGAFALFIYFGTVLSIFIHLFGYLFLGVLALYFALGIASSIQQCLRYKLLRHLVVLPFSFFFFHLIHGTGVLLGMTRLVVRAAPVQKIPEPWPGAGCFRVLQKKSNE